MKPNIKEKQNYATKYIKQILEFIEEEKFPFDEDGCIEYVDATILKIKIAKILAHIAIDKGE